MWELSALLFLLCSLVPGLAIELQSSEDKLVFLEPGRVYSSHIGNRTVYQLRNDQANHKFSIYSVSLTAAVDSSAEILIQGADGKYHANIKSPVYDADQKDDHYLISYRAKRNLCLDERPCCSFFSMYLAGNASSRYNLTVEKLNLEVRLNESVNTTTVVGDFDFTWFYYENNQTERPLNIEVTSESDVDSWLLVIEADCPTTRALKDSSDVALISWSKYGRVILSEARSPPLVTGRWFIGIQSKNATLEKVFNLKVSLGMALRDYGLPMALPPIFIAIAVFCVLGSMFVAMIFLTSQTGARATPSKSTWSYFLLTFTVATVFLVPGFQVISEELKKMDASGYQDLCYYNSRCQRPSSRVFGILSVNNVWSNIGYLIVGLGFIIYVALIRNAFKSGNVHAALPREASIPYAMGLAIMLEGIASGLYHLCPSRIIFQFDTANMIVILVLGEAEIFRRSIFTPSRGVVFFLIAVLVLFNYIGAMSDASPSSEYITLNPTTTTIMFFIFLTLFFALVVLPFMLKGPRDAYFSFWQNFSFSKISKKRLGVIVVLYLINATILLVNIFFKGNLGTTILAMLIATQTISVLSYEVINLNQIRKLPVWFLCIKGVLILLFVGMWSGAVYFFLSNNYNTDIPADASRAMNKDCMIGDFYDSHDVWHFLSAMALLLNCLIFFHLDFNANFKGAAFGERTGLSDLDSLMRSDLSVTTLVDLANDTGDLPETASLFSGRDGMDRHVLARSERGSEESIGEDAYHYEDDADFFVTASEGDNYDATASASSLNETRIGRHFDANDLRREGGNINNARTSRPDLYTQSMPAHF